MKKYQRLGAMGLAVMGLILIYGAILFVGQLAAAQKYPAKPILFVMPWPAGGGTDISMRPLVNAASRHLGQPIVMEYHPGGSTAVGMGVLKLKKPDGYAIGEATVSGMVSQHLRKVTYDMNKDFTYIMQYADYISGLVVDAKSPWKTLKEFLDYAKVNPGKVRYSVSGPGSPQRLVMANLEKQVGINWITVPFEGGPQALAALMGGHVEACTTTMLAKTHIFSGRLRLLATYGEKRNSTFPDVPTVTEAGYRDTYSNSMMILGPKGLSPEIVETLHQAFKKGLEDPEFIKACDQVDHAIVYKSPQETEKFIQNLNTEVGEMLRDLKLGKE